MLKSMSVADLVAEMVSKKGQGTLADEIGMDPAAFSRFRSGEGNISMKHLESLLSTSDAVILPKEDVKRIMTSFFTICDLWKKSVGW